MSGRAADLELIKVAIEDSRFSTRTKSDLMNRIFVEDKDDYEVAADNTLSMIIFLLQCLEDGKVW